MSLRQWLRAAVGGALLLTAVGAGAGVAPAHAASGRCPAGTGVTVVVDYGPLGGGVAYGCDPDGAGQPGSKVVPAAGFPLTYVSSQPGFVCRVSGKPASDPCQRTPPPDAYWGIFWSDGSSRTWKYASVGIGSLKVPEGGSIGWRFQDGGTRDDPSAPPTTGGSSPTPDPEPSKQPEPKPTKQPKPSQPPKSPSGPSGGGGGGSTPSQEPSGSPGGGGEASQTPEASGREGRTRAEQNRGGTEKTEQRPRRRERDRREPRREPDTDESPAVVAADDGPFEDAAPLSAAQQDSASSGLATGAAALAVVLLGSAAGAVAWRRRT